MQELSFAAGYDINSSSEEESDGESEDLAQLEATLKQKRDRFEVTRLIMLRDCSLQEEVYVDWLNGMKKSCDEFQKRVAEESRSAEQSFARRFAERRDRSREEEGERRGRGIKRSR